MSRSEKARYFCNGSCRSCRGRSTQGLAAHGSGARARVASRFQLLRQPALFCDVLESQEESSRLRRQPAGATVVQQHGSQPNPREILPKLKILQLDASRKNLFKELAKVGSLHSLAQLIRARRRPRPASSEQVVKGGVCMTTRRSALSSSNGSAPCPNVGRVHVLKRQGHEFDLLVRALR